jgi:hypothetical protein
MGGRMRNGRHCVTFKLGLILLYLTTIHIFLMTMKITRLAFSFMSISKTEHLTDEYVLFGMF